MGEDTEAVAGHLQKEESTRWPRALAVPWQEPGWKEQDGGKEALGYSGPIGQIRTVIRLQTCTIL